MNVVERHPEHRYSSMMDKQHHLPDSRPPGHHQCETYSSSTENGNRLAADVPMANNGDQSALEDAQFILGRNVAFTIIPNDDTFNAQEVVETLCNPPANSSSNPTTIETICVPRNKVASFHEALRERLARRSQQVVERAGRMAFWRGKEPFMRPVLSRSLSLP